MRPMKTEVVPPLSQIPCQPPVCDYRLRVSLWLEVSK